MMMATSQQINKSLIIDDTQLLSCFIQNTETENDHVVYLIKVQRGHDPKNSWQIKRRYNEFSELYNQLKVSNYELPLPPKKAFGNMKKEFLSTRQIGLQEFMDKLLSNLLLANSLPVKKFLDEDNYNENFREQALAHVSMFFRSESNWEIIEPLNDIGWRFRKKFILLKNNDSPGNKYILTWCEHGPDKILKESELKSIFQQFTQINHEFVDPILRINSGENSTIVIQKYNEKVISLRDFICGTKKINENYLKKYSLNKAYQKIPLDLIKLISKKLLVTLQFIYSKDLFYGHLHTGNILIDLNTNSIKLSDLTNGLLGLPYYFRSYIIGNRKIQNIELVDVYGFGHVLYEMIYGEQWSSTKRDFNDCPYRDIKQILESILSDEIISKNGLPTLNELLEMPFFKSINLDNLPGSSNLSKTTSPNSNSKLFTSSKTKELLTKAREFIEKRMNNEQKILYKLKRQSQAEAKLFSDEEIRKRRKEKKKAEKDLLNTLEFPTSPSSPVSINSQNGTVKKISKQKSSLSSSFKSDSTMSCMDNLSIQDTTSPPLSPLSPTTFSPVPPPPPPPPPLLMSAKGASGPPPPPPPPIPSTPIVKPSADRSQLLTSINSFTKTSLKKTKTNDRSAPKV